MTVAITSAKDDILGKRRAICLKQPSQGISKTPYSVLDSGRQRKTKRLEWGLSLHNNVFGKKQSKKSSPLPGGELNPGLPRDRRGY